MIINNQFRRPQLLYCLSWVGMIINNQFRRPQLLYCLLLPMLAAAGTLCCPSYAQEADKVTVQVLSPGEYQVVQRDAANQGSISVAVHIDGQPTAVEARLELMSNRVGMPGPYKGTTTDWIALTATEQTGEYIGEVTAAAGGWYELQVRIPAAAGGPTVATVPRIGIGEVFLTAGQSNTANRGKCNAPTDDRVVTFDGQGWRPAYDPQPGNDGRGGTPWPFLGDMLARSLQMPIGFAARAEGGTSTAFWLPGAEGYKRLKTVVQQLGRNGARAVLWHQGERDAGEGTSTETYASNLTRTINQLNQDAGYDIAWVVAAVSFCLDGKPEEMQQVTSGQRLLWQRGIALPGPTTDDLVGPLYREPDRLHLNSLGKQVYAERLFAMLWAQLYANVPLVVPPGDTNTKHG